MVASSILVASWKFFLETRLDLLNFLPKTFLKPLFLITISSLGAFLSLSYVGFNLFFLVTQFASLPIFLFFMAILLIVAQGQAISPSIFGLPSLSPLFIQRTCVKTSLVCTFHSSINVSKISCSEYFSIGISLEKAGGNFFWDKPNHRLLFFCAFKYVFPLLASHYVYFEQYLKMAKVYIGNFREAESFGWLYI